MPAPPKLFSSFRLRELTFRNRIFVSPMCQYSAVDGIPNTWHAVHLGSRAVGGAALVMAEATAVTATGRISPGDLGLWNEHQAEAFKPITSFIREQGAVPGIQLAHAGRKASTPLPWEGSKKLEIGEGGWVPLAPSPISFSPTSLVPAEISALDIDDLVKSFVTAAKRAEHAGFQVVELHMAHGYLLHEFLSPLSNKRKDEYGGSLENRMRFPLRVAAEVRAAWPVSWPVFVRISATDWAPEGGWDIGQSVQFAIGLKKVGIDLVDCSSGGTLDHAKIPLAPGYQVPFAESIRKNAGMATCAVGLITNAAEAEAILQAEKADAIAMAREFLRDPYFPLHAATELGVAIPWPKQYERARPAPKK
jgi:2,4-dienoyl-CoA reductase-like NADH-dependent reductase (Old Yellow Enzyme family)